MQRLMQLVEKDLSWLGSEIVEEVGNEDCDKMKLAA